MTQVDIIDGKPVIKVPANEVSAPSDTPTLDDLLANINEVLAEVRKLESDVERLSVLNPISLLDLFINRPSITY